MATYKISCFIKSAAKKGVEFKDGMGPGVFSSCLVDIPAEYDDKPDSVTSCLLDVAENLIKYDIDFNIESVEND